ncbi:MAG: hypothetical protein GQ547_00980 [Methylophaga sp.]|nr:hypothetical protein [Methylophaga sp.]
MFTEEKEALEFIFKIEDNCTKGTADESDFFNTIVDNIGKIFLDMSGEEKLIGLAILVFSFTGYKIFEKYSDTQVSKATLNAGSDALKIQKEAVFEALSASNNKPKISPKVMHHIESAYRSVLSTSSNASSVSIGENEWSSEEIESEA